MSQSSYNELTSYPTAMNKMKTIDKIGILIRFLGILGLFWLIRDKQISFVNFAVSTLIYAALACVLVLVSKKISPGMRYWINSVTTATMLTWFNYITSAKLKWDLLVILIFVCAGIEWKMQRNRPKPEPNIPSELIG